MPDAGVLATILLIVGFVLLALELTVPSFGMFGLCSLIALVVSAWCAHQAWWTSSPPFFWTYTGFLLLGLPMVIVGVLYLMQHTKVGDIVVLRGPEEADSRPADPLQELVGKTGRTTSLLTPGGMVIVGDERFHAESRGMLIESGTDVKVIGVNGGRLVVRKYVQSEENQHETARENSSDGRHESLPVKKSAAKAAKGDSADTLDFDIPEEYTAG